MNILGAIIAGGTSSRMGREKAFLDIGGVPLIERVASRLRFQVDALVLNANGEQARFCALGCPVVADELPEMATPLAGIHAVLRYAHARKFKAVVTVPSDTPFLPLDLVPRLAEAGSHKGAAIAMTLGQPHYLTGIWATALLPALERRMKEGDLRRVQDFAAATQAERVVWSDQPHDPFFNINTAEDLKLALGIAGADA
jgi:molybdopterin-guanine dinucleotide biosynthesis protein A